MLNHFSKLFVKNKSFSSFLNVPSYNFILGRMFKKQKPIDPKQTQQNAKIQAELYQQEKKKMKRQVQQQQQYDLLQRQKDIQLNRDFRKQQQKYKNTIPQDIGKGGFDQLVYWSQNAQTPQQIVDLITKFNKCNRPKKIQDEQVFYQFIQNVKATVYLAQSYQIMVEYAHFGYKYTLLQRQFWLKLQQKISRKPPANQRQISELIDIVFIMSNMQQGQIIYSSSQKILTNRSFTVQQLAKIIIAYFKTQKGQKQWVVSLLVDLQQNLNQASVEVLESILPVLKQSKNVPKSFDLKLQQRIIRLEKQLSLSLICIVSNYLGFQKGSKQVWDVLQNQAIPKLQQIKQQKGKIPSTIMTQIIQGILSSYKFSTQFVLNHILPEILAKDCKILYRLSPTTLSALSKCLYIYQLEKHSQVIQSTIQGLITKNFQKFSQVTNQQLVQVLKDYTVTRLGSRDFYLFLQSIVNDKLQDIKIQKYTVQTIYAIYQESNLCSTDTLELLKGMLYE